MVHHAARLIARLENGDAIAHQSEVVRRRNSRGPGAYHRDLLSASNICATLLQHWKMPASLVAFVGNAITQVILRVRLHRLDTVLFRNESLERANRDRRINLSATTSILAGRGANSATDGSKWIWRTGGEIRFFELTFSDQLHVLAGIGLYRASRLARNHALPEFDVGHKRLVLGLTHRQSWLARFASR